MSGLWHLRSQLVHHCLVDKRAETRLPGTIGSHSKIIQKIWGQLHDPTCSRQALISLVWCIFTHPMPAVKTHKSCQELHSKLSVKHESGCSGHESLHELMLDLHLTTVQLQ